MSQPLARIWCSTVPAAGHFGPLAPVAHALEGAGHRVSIVTSPSLVPMVKAAGLDALALGRPWLEADAEEAFPDCSRQGIPLFSLVFEEAAAQILPAMLAAAESDRPDLIVWTWPCELAGPVAADALGIPCVAVDTSPSIPRKLHAVSNLRALARLRHDAGLTPDIAQEWLEAVPHLSFYPPSLDLAAPGPLTRRARYEVFDRFPGGVSDAVRALIDDPKPIVLATLGTIFNRRGVMPELATALGHADWNVVLATGHVVKQMGLEDLASNVIATPWIPFSEILPHCSAVVHHGGTNTTLAVAAAGIPSVVVPLGADQFHNAVAVDGAGVGRVLLENSGRSAHIREATEDVLANPRYRQRADALREEMNAMPTVARVMPAMIAAALAS